MLVSQHCNRGMVSEPTLDWHLVLKGPHFFTNRVKIKKKFSTIFKLGFVRQEMNPSCTKNCTHFQIATPFTIDGNHQKIDVNDKIHLEILLLPIYDKLSGKLTFRWINHKILYFWNICKTCFFNVAVVRIFILF